MKRLALKVKIALALTVIATFVTASAFARVGKQDFTLHNQTGVEIHSLHVSPHSTDDWEEDIPAKDTLASGESVKITFDDHDKHVHWGLKVTDKDGNAPEWYDLHLFSLRDLTRHWAAAKGIRWADIQLF